MMQLFAEASSTDDMRTPTGAYVFLSSSSEFVYGYVGSFLIEMSV